MIYNPQNIALPFSPSKGEMPARQRGLMEGLGVVSPLLKGRCSKSRGVWQRGLAEGFVSSPLGVGGKGGSRA